MSNELDDILKGSGELNQQRLLDYLEGKLTPEERHEVEKQMADSNFANDAIEGLQSIGNRKDLSRLVHELNTKLHQQLQERKQHKEQRRIKEYPWVYLAIIIILALAVISYLIIKKVQQKDSGGGTRTEQRS